MSSTVITEYGMNGLSSFPLLDSWRKNSEYIEKNLHSYSVDSLNIHPNALGSGNTNCKCTFC